MCTNNSVLHGKRENILQIQVYIVHALLHTNNIVNQAVHSLSESRGR